MLHLAMICGYRLLCTVASIKSGGGSHLSLRLYAMAEAEEVRMTTVQELAESGRAPPVHYIQKEDDRQVEAVLPPTPIPVVDLSLLLEPGGDDEAAKLLSALQSWGLFQMQDCLAEEDNQDQEAIGHDMSVSFLDEVHNVSRKFFQLPVEVKQKYIVKYGKGFPEGYGNDHAATEDQILTWTDRLRLLVQPENERKLDLWPEEPSSFRDVLNELTMKTKKIMEHVLKALAKLLQLNEDYFINQFEDKATVYTRFNHYPCCSRPDLVLGLKPHSDDSVITVLFPDKDVEGLQVLKDGVWVKIPTIPCAVLVIVGDEMEIMSNGIFKSPVHKVITNSEKERISVTVLYFLEPEKELGPADGLLDEMRPRLYKTMKTKDYLEAFHQHYIKGKRAIEWAKM